MEIGKVTIGYLSKSIKTGIIENQKTLYHVVREDIGERLCIIDKKYAIDLENFNNKYEIINRDENHRILNDVYPGVVYALKIDLLDKQASKEYKPKIKQYKKNTKFNIL